MGGPGETGRGGGQKNQKIGEFSLRGILQPTTSVPLNPTVAMRCASSRVNPRYRPHLSPRQRPMAKARLDQAALAASAEARGATHRARPRSPSGLTLNPALAALAQHISHSHSCIYISISISISLSLYINLSRATCTSIHLYLYLYHSSSPFSLSSHTHTHTHTHGIDEKRPTEKLVHLQRQFHSFRRSRCGERLPAQSRGAPYVPAAEPPNLLLDPPPHRPAPSPRRPPSPLAAWDDSPSPRRLPSHPARWVPPSCPQAPSCLGTPCSPYPAPCPSRTPSDRRRWSACTRTAKAPRVG